jgi:4-hydroxybenzoate polyprenyltransferase
MDAYTDIRTGGWLNRLPPGLVPYAILARYDRPIGAWLLFLPGLWSITLAARSFWQWIALIFLFFIGAFIMRAAGCVVNDLWDRKMDAAVERTRTRPLASGALTPLNALIFLALLCTLGLLILLCLNTQARWLGVFSLILVVTYPLAKRVTWWPQIMLGLTFGWAAPMGYTAATGHILAWPSLFLYAAAISWILGYDTIYAHQDREDDALIGIKSTARLFAHNTRILLLASYSATILLLLAAFATAHLNHAASWLLIPPAALLAHQIIRLDINNQATCLNLFKANRYVGLAIGLATVVGRF